MEDNMPAPKGNKFAVGNSGKPPIFKTPEELEAKITEYFDNCPDTKTVVMRTKDGIFREEIPCPTVTGLALFLGFCDRQSLYDYQSKNEEYSCIIKRARTKAERVYEQLLQDGNSGAIFALKNMGWTDKQEINLNQKTDLSSLSTEELVKRAEALIKLEK